MNKEKADSIIKEVNEKKDSLTGIEKIDFDKADTELRNIVKMFIGDTNKGIGHIIQKYGETIWNC